MGPRTPQIYKDNQILNLKKIIKQRKRNLDIRFLQAHVILLCYGFPVASVFYLEGFFGVIPQVVLSRRQKRRWKALHSPSEYSAMHFSIPDTADILDPKGSSYTVSRRAFRRFYQRERSISQNNFCCGFLLGVPSHMRRQQNSCRILQRTVLKTRVIQ